MRDIVAIATRCLWSAALQLASAICWHYWPGCCWQHVLGIELHYLALKRVDYLAYDIGLSWGVVCESNVGVLKPQIAVLATAVSHSDVLVVGTGSARSIVA
ncbi:hypothetical protein A8144_09770 [Mycobacterium leprae 3125609]|nr:hypothetical protein A8144_09770 [Mycobacterium leprae 3125609]OAX70834.1 hypothetical protein A3216_09555 [Mycobacterium leprae 7935681]